MIIRDTNATLETACGDTFESSAQMSYDPSDPLAVTVTFINVPWTFSRDMLIEGLDKPAGFGDVIVTTVGDSVFLRLSSDDGQALVELKTAEVRRFVAATTTAVPQGTETIDVDAWLSTLFETA